MSKLTNLQGNKACALGAIKAGCRFYAGYPITPSSEIAEAMARELPLVDGTFIQMEDELASMAAVVGASAGGVMSMTATSGPGFSLKQENIGFAAMTEIPCVIINVMRGGPSTGMPTRPAQGDIMQARWGTHGDHPVIALTPWSVEEVYVETQRAFSLSESLRTPVVVMFDESIAHLIESVDLSSVASASIITRKKAVGSVETFKPYAITEDLVPPMVCPGDGFRSHTTGLTHGEDGFPTQEPEAAQSAVKRLLDKIEVNREKIEKFEAIDCDDSDVVIAAYGITARAASYAREQLETMGIRCGVFRPLTLWPFPEEAFKSAVQSAKLVLVPEMNAGQLLTELERLATPTQSVLGLNKFDGEPIDPNAMIKKIREFLDE
jgi:2-oxoglutarate/2-oxoacid ferredoxin oxidoreductase subunit alpha